MSLPSSYFDAMYAADSDPWGFERRWYESRKRDITMASLPRERFDRVFEPGCSTGMLTRELSYRCDYLLATDVADAAIEQAQQRVAGSNHVDIQRRALPEEWPTGKWDLIVLSEVGYYLEPSALTKTLEVASESLVVGGVLLACHWRHPVTDYPMGGDAVHELIAATDGLHLMVSHIEADFRLDVFTTEPLWSVAEEAGLTP